MTAIAFVSSSASSIRVPDRRTELMSPSRHPTARRVKLAMPVLAAALGIALVAIALLSREQRFVAAPALACMVIALWAAVTLWDRDRSVPLFDIGFLCIFATFVYSVFPLLNYWLHGFQFGSLSDSRLAAYAPGMEDIGKFHFRHVLYLFSLAVFYVGFRGRGRIRTGNVEPAPATTQYTVVVLFVALLLFFFTLRLTTGITFHSSYEATAFSNKIEAFSSAPLWLVQISGKLAGIQSVLKLALLYIVVSRCRRRGWRLILILWVAVEVIQPMLVLGQRSGMMFFLLTTVLLYHRLVRPLSFKALAMVGSAVFVLFMFLGFYRSFQDLTALRSDVVAADTSVLARTNEFQSLLGTAYDVAQRKAAGATLPWYLYINDFVDVLPPQQLLPFEKVPAAEWYLREIGRSGTGEGYMWGVIAQAIVGLDWIELAVRGSILGLVLAWLHRWYRRRQSGFMETFMYMYLCIIIFSTFRNTTGSFLANIVWELIPFYFITTLGAMLLSKQRPRRPRMGESGSAVGSLS
jgi:hypothetical protein